MDIVVPLLDSPRERHNDWRLCDGHSSLHPRNISVDPANSDSLGCMQINFNHDSNSGLRRDIPEVERDEVVLSSVDREEEAEFVYQIYWMMSMW